MGGSLFFFVESKSFEFSVEEGGSFFLLRIFERGRDSLQSVFLGKESAKRLFSMMENLDLCIRLVRGPLGTWEISWSKVTEVDSSFSQSSNPKPIDSFKPKHTPTPLFGQYSTPKPFQASNPKPTQTSAFEWPNTKPKALPTSNLKPNHKPVYKWKPKPHRPSLTQYQTHPHSSQAPPTHLFSSASSITGSDMTDAEPTLTHMEPTYTEKLLSVLDNSNASVTESMSSDASVDESLCSDGDVALQRNIQQIIHQHTDNVIKKWGNSKQWVLELRDGKRVAVLIQISLPLGVVVVRVDNSNQLAMVPGVALESKEFNSELEKGIDVIVEDWVSDICSEDASQFADSSPPLNVNPLALSLPLGAMDISDQPATLDVETLLGKDIYSEWF